MNKTFPNPQDSAAMEKLIEKTKGYKSKKVQSKNYTQPQTLSQTI